MSGQAKHHINRRSPDSLGQAVTIFHDVRSFAYLSDGERDPKIIAARRRGSCTGKHLVLRDLLRHAGYDAEIETVKGDFAAGLPQHHSMPQDLRAVIATGGITDFHHFVWLNWRGNRILLDATWHDALKPYGFQVNDWWDGSTNTQPALKPDTYLGPHEDIISFKAACLETLDADLLAQRRSFLGLLSNWIQSKTPQSTG